MTQPKTLHMKATTLITIGLLSIAAGIAVGFGLAHYLG